jgi:hypothetical protein
MYFLNGLFWRHLFTFTRATVRHFNHTVFQTTRTNGDAPWQTNQIHGGEFAPCPLFAIIVKRIKTQREKGFI